MAAKRLRDGCDDGEKSPAKPEEKRIRRLPSFATVIKEAMIQNSLQNLCLKLEPLLRRVVKEEVERGIVHGARFLQPSPQMKIQMVESSSLKLIFGNPLSLPIFTGSKIEDKDGNPLQILLIDCSSKSLVQNSPSPIKIELHVLDGEFPGDRDDWTADEFNSKIVKERTGKRPLLIGDVQGTLRDGIIIIDDLSFTDNSSWIKCRQFRIGARVALDGYNGPRIKEAMTDSFMVKDHRGELYRKHYPPALGDQVWRLERIGKEGAFHKKLKEEGIKTVQDFLKLWVVDPDQLRSILGMGMSDRMWEGTINHARTCNLEGKQYIYRNSHATVILDGICQVMAIYFDDIAYALNDLNVQQQIFVQHLVREARQNWDKVEEITDGHIITGNTAAVLQNTAMLQGLEFHQGTTSALPIVGLEEAGGLTNNLQAGYSSSMQSAACWTSAYQL